MMINKWNIGVFCIIALLGIAGFLFPHHSNAQIARPSSVSIEVIPNYPQPNQEVALRIATYSFDVSRAYTTWSVNGEIVEEGYGIEEIELNSGDAGTEKQISVDISLDGSVISRTMTLAPLGVDFVWEAVGGYTPPFYEGKTLGVKEGRMRIIAYPKIPNPDGGWYPADELVYDWEHNGTTMQGSSGFGKQAYTFTQSYIHPEDEIFVTVSTLEGNRVARGSYTFEPGPPELLLYRSTGPSQAQEYLGDGVTVSQPQINVFAIPYFFTADSPQDEHLTYEWEVNDDQLQTPPEKSVVQLVNPSGRRAEVTISLNVVNTNTLFQETDVFSTFNVE